MKHVRPNKEYNQEIAQIALMRGCWSRSEEVFSKQLKRIIDNWTGGRNEAGSRLYRRLLEGRQVAAELQFVTQPLVQMLIALQQGRAQVDAALQLAIAADPLASAEGARLDVPPGYISAVEAARRLDVQYPSHLGGAAHIVAYARSIRVIGLGKSGLLRYFAEQDIEAACQILADERNERISRRLTRNIRRRVAPTGAVPAREVARRIGRPYETVVDGTRSGRNTVPTMYRFGHRWFSFEADIVAFLAQRSAGEARLVQLRSEGWLDTRAAAAWVGLSQSGFIDNCRRRGIEPFRFEHHALYSPKHLDIIRAARECQDRADAEAKAEAKAKAKALRNEKERKAARERKRADRARERQQLIDRGIKAPSVTVVAMASIPEGAIPIREVLLRIGMTRRRFDKIRHGLSGTPIPRVHKAPSGHLYCLPDDLETFCANRPRNEAEMVKEAQIDAQINAAILNAVMQ